MGEERILKSQFNLKIITVERVDDKLKIIDSQIERCRGKDFTNSLIEERDRGINHTIEYTNGEPVQFKLGVVYIRKDGKFVWIYKEN